MARVEGYGVEPVPAALRTGTWRDLFAINFAFFLNPLMYLIGALAVSAGGLPLWWAVICLVSAQVISFLLLTVAARPGVQYGIPGQVATRSVLGYWGARIVSSIYRAIAAIYWFASQALAGSLGIQALAKGLFGWELRLVPIALVLAAIQGVLAVLGFDVMRWVVKVILPLAVMFVVVILALYFTTGDEAYQPSRVFDSPDQKLTWIGFATWMTVMVGSSLTTVTAMADFCRYTRSSRDMKIGFWASGLIAGFLTTFIGGYAAAASGESNPFVAALDLTGSKVLLALLLVAVIVQMTAVNIINLYSAGLALVNTVPRVGRMWTTVFAACVGFGLSALPEFVTQAEKWITHLGNVASPLTGVMVVDYLVFQRARLDVDDLYEPEGRYRYLGGYNAAAFAAIAITVPVYYAVPGEWLKWVWGVGLGAALYWVLRTVQGRVLAGGRDGVPAGRA
jgi:NCS1 nucleoside transporter family